MCSNIYLFFDKFLPEVFCLEANIQGREFVVVDVAILVVVVVVSVVAVVVFVVVFGLLVFLLVFFMFVDSRKC